MKLYSVYDIVMKSYAPPFVAKNDGVACRMFLQGAKKINNFSDLKLYRLADWNDEDIDFPVNPFQAIEVPVDISGGEDD